MSQRDAESGTTQVGRTTEAQSQDTTKSKLVSLLAINKVSEWKGALSGALDDQRLFWALFVLSIFYIIYILVNTTHNDNEKDEDSITKLCKCNPNHRFFYVVWFSCCFFLWVVCHFIVLIGDSKDYFAREWNWNCSCSCCSSEQSQGRQWQTDDNHSKGIRLLYLVFTID